MKPEISIAILTYNSAATLEGCIASILGQNFAKHRYEILAVDNGSTDNTPDIFLRCGIRYSVHPGRNISQLRNIAINNAAAPIVGFIDSDCIVDRDWIASAVRWFVDGGVALVGYKYLLPEKPSCFEKNWYGQMKRVVSSNAIIPAGNMIVSKRIVQEVQGFDETIVTGEDADLLTRIRGRGYLTVSDPDISSIHLGNPKNLREFYLKERWYGLGIHFGGAFVHRDKPLIASIFILLGGLLAILGMAIQSKWIILGSVSGMVAVVLVSALDRKYNKQSSGSITFLMVAYVVYFAARITAVVYRVLGIRSFDKKRITITKLR